MYLKSGNFKGTTRSGRIANCFTKILISRERKKLFKQTEANFSLFIVVYRKNIDNNEYIY